MTDTKLPRLEGTLVDGEKYFCTMKFTTVGSSNGVQMDYDYSHDFDDDYRGDVPASYLAMRDMAVMLTQMTQAMDDTSAESKADAILELGNGLTENNSTKH